MQRKRRSSATPAAVRGPSLASLKSAGGSVRHLKSAGGSIRHLVGTQLFGGGEVLDAPAGSGEDAVLAHWLTCEFYENETLEQRYRHETWERALPKMRLASFVATSAYTIVSAKSFIEWHSRGFGPIGAGYITSTCILWLLMLVMCYVFCRSYLCESEWLERVFPLVTLGFSLALSAYSICSDWVVMLKLHPSVSENVQADDLGTAGLAYTFCVILLYVAVNYHLRFPLCSVLAAFMVICELTIKITLDVDGYRAEDTALAVVALSMILWAVHQHEINLRSGYLWSIHQEKRSRHLAGQVKRLRSRLELAANEANDKRTKLEIEKAKGAVERLKPGAMKSIHKIRAEFADLTIHENIGTGSFGEVYRGTLHTKRGGLEQCVAIKRIPKHKIDVEAVQSMLLEIIFMAPLRHPNICGMLAWIDDPYVCIVLEFCVHGSMRTWLTNTRTLGPNAFEAVEYETLEDFVEAKVLHDKEVEGNSGDGDREGASSPSEERGSVSSLARGSDVQRRTRSPRVIVNPPWWSCKMKMATDIAKGLGYLHQRKVLHRDLKADNVLVDHRLRVKIADFGTARENANDLGGDGKKNQNTMTRVGSPLWIAPEVIREEGHYDATADIWAFGVTLIEMITHRDPYQDHRGKACFNLLRVVDGDLNPTFQSVLAKANPSPREIILIFAQASNSISSLKERAIAAAQRAEMANRRMSMSELTLPPIGLFDLVEKCCNYEPSRRGTMKDALFALMLVDVELETRQYEYDGAILMRDRSGREAAAAPIDSLCYFQMGC